MANPQKENGFTAIANEILEALINAGLNGSEWAVVMLVLRKTYGFQKKEDEIALSQFTKNTPYTLPTICKALKVLQLVKVIKLVKVGKSKICSNLYTFNKNYEEWQLVRKAKLVKVRKSTSKDLEIQLVKKPLDTKETIQKKDTKEREREHREVRVEEELLLKMQGRYVGDVVGEIEEFEKYWNEKAVKGDRLRWEMEKVFEVDRRFSTWLGRAKGIQRINDEYYKKQMVELGDLVFAHRFGGELAKKYINTKI